MNCVSSPDHRRRPAERAPLQHLRRGRAARHLPRAERGQPPVGSPAPADFRGRPARVSHLPRRDADCRVHHPSVGDRPDPHPPPLLRGPRGKRRRAESPVDAPTAPWVRPPRRPAPPRGRSARAAVPPRRHLGPRRPRVTRPDRRHNGPRGIPAWSRSRRSPLAGASERQGTAAYTQRTPIEFPIPTFAETRAPDRRGCARRRNSYIS